MTIHTNELDVDSTTPAANIASRTNIVDSATPAGDNLDEVLADRVSALEGESVADLQAILDDFETRIAELEVE